MKKAKQFTAGDKVFAKVKGYPPWPAKIISENGKKYNVEFYGTGETGSIKVEDIFYYLKHKEKFQKPLKRKDYVDAFEQIEEAIKKDGGDGDSSDADDSIINATLNSTNASVDTPVKGKKSIKRKRSVSEKTVSPDVAPSPKKMGRPRKTVEAVSEEPADNKTDEIKPEMPVKQSTPTKKSPRVKKEKEEPAKTDEEQEVSPTKDGQKKEKGVEKKDKISDKKEKVDDKKEKVVAKKDKTVEKTDEKMNEAADKKEKATERKMRMKSEHVTGDSEAIADKMDVNDEKIEVVSEKFLKNNIAYAKMVKESDSYYKDKPVEPREDYFNQVLAVKLPSSEDVGGLKLHLNWPLKFENEHERALYDESVALRLLDAKLKVASGDQTIINDSKAFIKNIDINAEAVKKSIYVKDLELKKARIARLKIEAELTGLDAKIKNCLGLDKADPKEALGYLEAMCEIEFDEIMLKKHTHIVEMVRRLRKYVGNTKEWNMSEESLNEFSNWAEKVRAKAESVYSKFKEVMKIPDNCNSFWEGFMESVSKFRADCKDLSETQIFMLCSEPRSRRAFLDRLDEMETEKENSSEGANTEVKLEAVNGTTETPTA